MTGLFRYGRLPGYTPHCTAQSCPPRYPRSFAMKRLSAVFSARMGAVLASAALLSGCVVMPVEGGYRHHDRYEHYESHDRYDRYEGHHAHRYGHPPPPRAERRPPPTRARLCLEPRQLGLERPALPLAAGPLALRAPGTTTARAPWATTPRPSPWAAPTCPTSAQGAPRPSAA